MKKIQIYVENIKYCEADKQVILLANSLSNYFDITIISFGNINNEIVLNKKIKLYELNMNDIKGYFNNLKLKNSITKFFKDNVSDIVISTSIHINKILVQLKLEAELIYWRLDNNLIDVDNYKKYFNGFTKLVFRTEEEKDKYNFINIEQIVIPPAIGSVPLDYEYAKGKNIVYIGNLDNKEIAKNLVDIMSIVDIKDDKIKLNIIGDGEYIDYMKDYSKQIDLEKRIVFHGNLDENEIDYELKRMSIFLNLDNSNTNNTMLIEAMNYGIPPISYYNETLKNIIENDINGYLLNSESSLEDFAKKILASFESNETLTNMRLCARETSMFYEISSIKGEWLKIL